MVSAGRKPADVAAQARYGNQDSIWKTIRENRSRSFTCSELVCLMLKAGVSNVNDSTVTSYLYRLVKGGYLSMEKPSKVKSELNRPAVYKLKKDCGHEAPRLTKEGEPVQQGRGNEHMWRSMKVLGTFDTTALSLAATTDTVIVKKATASTYLTLLHKAGYLKVVKKSKPGTQAVYRLLPGKNTGPLPPQIQRTKRVFDPNLSKVVWSEDNEYCE